MYPEEYFVRAQKRQEILEHEGQAYPSRFEGGLWIHDLLSTHKAQDLEDLLQNLPQKEYPKKRIRGRMMSYREHGKLHFASLQDQSGSIQICFMKDLLGAENFDTLKRIDVGDFLGLEGDLFTTKHGQITLLVSSWWILSKALRPLPEKWHGIQDQELLYRQRYLDMVMNEETKNRFLLRSQLIKSLRNYLDAHHFLEVETPVLSSKASGATASPFMTHHRALDLDVYLRIAPELYLKRCVAGGLERVYEFARCFRNEGMDPSHLQEFTMLEYYASYWNYEDNMDFTEKMLRHVLQEVFGSLRITMPSRTGEMVEIDFSQPWPRLDFRQMIVDASGIDIDAMDENPETLRQAIREKKILIEDMDSMGFGNLCDYLYKKICRPNLIQPCFVIHHPVDMKPLARKLDATPKRCETFQLLVNTWELINAYSEIVDPVDQKERFITQAAAQAHGDEEAMEMDTDFVKCMEHGMPPMSGWGMGIDRLITLLTGQSNLRDSVLFPIMKPSQEELDMEALWREEAKNLNL